MPPPSVAAVAPAGRLRGSLRVPGDKSISHRYALLAAIASGPSRIGYYAPGADCRSTLSCLSALGVALDRAGDTVTVMGRGAASLRSPDGPLDAGNSGTTMRLVAGLLAGLPVTATLVGDASLSRRPMRRVMAPLTEMGARLDAVDGHAPVTIHGTRLHAIAYTTNPPSAQVKSAILLAGLHADGTTRVTEAAATRDHTERALPAFGGRVTTAGLTVAIEGGQALTGRDLVVPGDFSSAAFWLVAAAARPGSRVEIAGVGLNPSRTALLDVLRRYGASVTVEEEPGDVSGGEPRGTVVVEYRTASEVTIAPADVPALIDELPAIAALAAGGAGVRVTGAEELRVKESDRIATLVAGFRALGYDADERPDGFDIAAPRERVTGGRANAAGDHRMAMAFAIAALAADTPSTIEGADAVDISYPGFFETLATLADGA